MKYNRLLVVGALCSQTSEAIKVKSTNQTAVNSNSQANTNNQNLSKIN